MVLYFKCKFKQKGKQLNKITLIVMKFMKRNFSLTFCAFQYTVYDLFEQILYSKEYS